MTTGPILEALIDSEASRLGHSLEPRLCTRLASYFRLVERWGARIRLTGSNDAHELVRRHLGDALFLAVALARYAPGARALDVGSGGGLPSLPLLLLEPACALTMVEANGRKAAFLRTALHELSLEAKVIDRRLEEVVAAEAGEVGRATPALAFDAAWSLATFAPLDWLERARTLVVEGGTVFVFLVRDELEVPARLVELERFGWSLHDGRPRKLVCLRRESGAA